MHTGTDWVERIEQLRRHSQSGQRAPHKPLLLLYMIGRFVDTRSGRVSYAEAEPVLSELLGRYGSSGTGLTPQYPFNRLRNDEGFWGVSTTDGSSWPGERVGQLREVGVGELSPEFETALRDPGIRAAIVNALLDQIEHGDHVELLKDVGLGVLLTRRFDRALAFARHRHDGQLRKGTSTPYVSHLMATASLVLEAGGDEDQAIAGLLHDSLEDADITKVTYDELVAEFGRRVADIVRDCSDSEGEGPKSSWRQRKERYIESLRHHSLNSVLVSNADKVHNARSILSDYHIHGEELWARFNAESDSLWYYRALANTFLDLGSPLAAELDRVVVQLETAVAANHHEG